ncbi:MAG: tRNA (adenosine(37)-N6)-dimethylallyltransferase MiaA [Candidatus Omnitrophica bacterium]|nr:tRNA (adenosine(37)-N6)-dimethylallyltransferase MiaA [Candidatus Omnitrophota bacterium]
MLSRTTRKKPLIVFVVGPTAVGKSEVALRLAKRLDAEIISCDSMQVYKGMEIITSKIPPAKRKIIPHHLIDVIPPDKEYDVSRYRRTAVRKVEEIIKRKKVPLFVGGTGLYLSVLLDGIFHLKPINPAIRKDLYRQAEDSKGIVLYARLKEVDSQTAAKIHSRDTKRIIRALEVYESTGRTISDLQRRRKGLSDAYTPRVFCLTMPRQRLYARINTRVDTMFRQGLVAEIQRLKNLSLSKTASYAIGIRELQSYFEGKCDLESARELIKRNTRRYAKRQLTWFRKDKRIKWVEIREKETPSMVARRIVRMLQE